MADGPAWPICKLKIWISEGLVHASPGPGCYQSSLQIYIIYISLSIHIYIHIYIYIYIYYFIHRCGWTAWPTRSSKKTSSKLSLCDPFCNAALCSGAGNFPGATVTNYSGPEPPVPLHNGSIANICFKRGDLNNVSSIMIYSSTDRSFVSAMNITV